MILAQSLMALDNQSPERFKSDIDSFIKEDGASPPQSNKVLCIGSSSMRMWHPEISNDLKPLSLIKTGFGGSTMKDVLYYTKEIVLAYKPRAILIYEGGQWYKLWS